MKGKVLDFSVPESRGFISGDDGNRYVFMGQEWKSLVVPHAGTRVDFDTVERTAVGIYLDGPAGSPPRIAGATGGDEPTAGFYRSCDEKVVAGVCSGLAHKWHISRTGLRVATALATLFVGLPLLIYIACWVIFPLQSTKAP